MELAKKNIQQCLQKGGGGEGVFYFVGKYFNKLFIKMYKHENISNAKSVGLPLKRNLCKNVTIATG